MLSSCHSTNAKDAILWHLTLGRLLQYLTPFGSVFIGSPADDDQIGPPYYEREQLEDANKSQFAPATMVQSQNFGPDFRSQHIYLKIVQASYLTFG